MLGTADSGLVVAIEMASFVWMLLTEPSY
jgi:hypothetical protein